MRNAAELEVHAAARRDGTLVVERTTCVTVACLEAATVGQLHALAAEMPQLHYLRLACAMIVHNGVRRWAGRHMVVDAMVCEASDHHDEAYHDGLFALLEVSPSLTALSLRVCSQFLRLFALGTRFAERVEQLRLGDRDHPCRSVDRPLLVGKDAHLARLRSIRLFEASFDELAETIVGERGTDDALAQCPSLRYVHLGLTESPVRWPGTQKWAATRLFTELPVTCSRVVCELGNDKAGAAGRFVEIPDTAVRQSERVPFTALVVDVRRSSDEAKREALQAAEALEGACAVKGVTLEVCA